MTNTPEEIEFILNAIRVMDELNSQLKEIGGENEASRQVDENIRLLRESIEKQEH